MIYAPEIMSFIISTTEKDIYTCDQRETTSLEICLQMW